MKADEGNDQTERAGEARAMERAFRRAADQLAGDRRFLGHALGVYRGIHGMSEEQLAGALGCEARAIVPLAMCFMPRSEGLAGKEGGTFREDVEAIAAAGPCDAAALGRVVKEVAAVVALGEGIAGGGWLMAARDRQTGEKGGDLSSGEKGVGT